MPDVAAHRQNGFNSPVVHLVERVFRQTGKEWKGADGYRHDGGGAAQRGADDQPGKGDQGDQQYDKRQRPADVDHRA
ncbi:Uncharacterised protein [Klebsiella pneumoniae]|nr:Uncharacterised protein [Klebsiella pneumoniae]